jgi:hypothetical protein
MNSRPDWMPAAKCQEVTNVFLWLAQQYRGSGGYRVRFAGDSTYVNSDSYRAHLMESAVAIGSRLL